MRTRDEMFRNALNELGELALIFTDSCPIHGQDSILQNMCRAIHDMN
jgi:hypothetical protein